MEAFILEVLEFLLAAPSEGKTLLSPLVVLALWLISAVFLAAVSIKDIRSGVNYTFQLLRRVKVRSEIV